MSEDQLGGPTVVRGHVCRFTSLRTHAVELVIGHGRLLGRSLQDTVGRLDCGRGREASSQKTNRNNSNRI